MKIRTDYVTNSSSSSFIVAKHKDFTKEELRVHLLENEVEIIKFYKDCYREDLREEHTTLNSFIDYLVNELFILADYGLLLDNWTVESDVCSNEDGTLLMFLYEKGFGTILDKFKITYGG